jgi:hypothetical protein
MIKNTPALTNLLGPREKGKKKKKKEESPTISLELINHKWRRSKWRRPRRRDRPAGWFVSATRKDLDSSNLMPATKISSFTTPPSNPTVDTVLFTKTTSSSSPFY